VSLSNGFMVAISLMTTFSFFTACATDEPGYCGALYQTSWICKGPLCSIDVRPEVHLIEAKSLMYVIKRVQTTLCQCLQV
jgi:hypothetical protein